MTHLTMSRLPVWCRNKHGKRTSLKLHAYELKNFAKGSTIIDATLATEIDPQGPFIDSFFDEVLVIVSLHLYQHLREDCLTLRCLVVVHIACHLELGRSDPFYVKFWLEVLVVFYGLHHFLHLFVHKDVYKEVI